MNDPKRYVVIRSAVADPRGFDAGPDNGEYLILVNVGSDSVGVGNWSVEDLVGHRITIPPGYNISPGGQLRLYTATGINAPDRYYAGRHQAILNNTHDSLRLFDDTGVIRQIFSY
jgi:hypothetical protein